MKKWLRVILSAVSLCSIGVAVAADWWAVQPLSMPVRPDAGSLALQNPPLFSWPIRSGSSGYEVQVAGPSGTSTYRTAQNWLHLKSALASGNYRWRVRALAGSGGGATDWSEERGFRVTSDSAPFLVPDPDGLMTRAASLKHPRGFPRGNEWSQLKAALSGDRAKDIAQLKTRLQKLVGAPLLPEPSTAFNLMEAGAAKAQGMSDVRNALADEQEAVLGLGLLWFLEGNRVWLDEAKRRALWLAKWNPEGSTGLVSHNQATRTILLTVATAYDWFFDEWSSGEKTVLLGCIRKRYGDLHAFIVGNSSLATNPHNPWASYTLGYLVATAPLIAGDLTDSSPWFSSAFSLYAATFPAWSGDDGGYANGTAYGVWDVPESIVLWDFLRWSTNFDFYQKPAIRNFAKFMAYFLPPGSPQGVFGDGAEVKMAPSIARYAKAFAGRVPSPLFNWYADQLFGENRSAFSVLTTPPGSPGPHRLPSGVADSAIFPSVGWVAMHSALADRSRLSVYFKSSPYGSFNHSHADQNSFVIYARGRVGAMDSGIYDYYNSPHWREWYKQTRAHNAITYDGGRGQGLGEQGTGSKAFNGRIERFSSSQGVDIAVGDATSSYQGEVSKAKRWVALIRPNTIVVADQLVSAQARQWEWNYHTPSLPTASGSQLTYGDADARFCVHVSSPQGLNYKVMEGYNPPPVSSPTADKHFWSRFSYSTPNQQGLFIAVIEIDCNGDAPNISWSGNRAALSIRDKKVTFSGNELVIQ